MLINQTNVINFNDIELEKAILGEIQRQQDHITLIASENYASKGVLALQGSILTNKYAEGYPEKRYYSGCEYVDILENLAISRAKLLFNASFANVQSHSGSQANAAVYLALLNAGDTILGMNLNHGGHLTHGSLVNFSGKIYKAIFYGIDLDTGLIDYNQVEDMARKYKPKAIIAGFSSYSRIADWVKFRYIADMVSAYLIADISHIAGLVCTGLYPSPINIADVTTTTTHKTLRGPRSGIILAQDNPDITKKINAAVFPGLQGGPLMHAIASKALAFKEAMQPEFKIYQKQVIANARYFADQLIQREYNIVSGGTDCHLFTVNLIKNNLNGRDVNNALNLANINVNKNTIPNDPLPPTITSGIRIGTPAITTRGFKESEIDLLVHWICDILNNVHKVKTLDKVKTEVIALCNKFPIY